MKYLFDTNVISELYKPRPSAAVLTWMKRIDPAEAYISVLVLGEMRRGIEIKRKNYPDAVGMLESLIEEIEYSYYGRIWDFDSKAAHIWGKITVARPRDMVDAQIAAIALSHDAILVTRNTKDFKELGVKLFNPFEPSHA